MITEDYVSFETAKLLKEKGFDTVKRCNSPHFAFNIDGQFSGPSWDSEYTAPTLQMAMKWLRDIYGLFIHISVIREASCWLADIQDIKGDVSIFPVENEFSNYEQAVEAAIKYCLENLI